MAVITNVKISPIQGQLGVLKRSSGYEYRDFWYDKKTGKKVPAGTKNAVHIVGWHRAVDITTLGTIVAVEKGKVIDVVNTVKGHTTNPGSGNRVILEHANGDKTYYYHLDYNSIPANIKKGAIVEKQQKLGTDTIKTTGNSTGRHLHFAVYKSKTFINPVDLLQGTILLKPYGYQEPVEDKLKVNDKVKIINYGNASSSGGPRIAGGLGFVRYVTKIHEGARYPYQVGTKGLTDSRHTTGFYKKEALRRI